MADIPETPPGAAAPPSEVPEDDVFESQLESINLKLQSFEGPLDLLVHLIKKNKMNVYDIQISVVTKQYLDYLIEERQYGQAEYPTPPGFQVHGEGQAPKAGHVEGARIPRGEACGPADDGPWRVEAHGADVREAKAEIMRVVEGGGHLLGGGGEAAEDR